MEGKDGTISDVSAPISKAECISITGCTRSLADSYRSRCSNYVFDDDWLSERGAHSFGYDAPDSIGRPACGKRYDHRYRARWVGLCRHRFNAR